MAITKIKTDDQFISLMAQIDAAEITLKDAASLLNVTSAGLHKKRAKWLRQQKPASLEKLVSAKQIFCQAISAGAGKKQAAQMAYPDAKETSLSVIASQLMAEPNNQVAIQDLFARNGIDKNFRVSKLAEVINSPDLNLAVKGLDQSWKLDGSYAPDKIEVGVTAESLRALTAAVREASLPHRTIDITPE